jgi:hypothetical protein
LINLTISSPFSNVFISSLYIIFYHWSIYFAYYFSLEHYQCVLFCYCPCFCPVCSNRSD